MIAITEKIRWLFQGRDGTAATFQTMLSRCIVMALNLITGIVIARMLGADGRGEQAVIILWPQFFSCVMTLGVPSALIYNLKRYPDEQAKFFTAATIVSLILGSVAAVLGAELIPLWMQNYSASVIRATQWAMAITPLLLLAITFSSALEACEQFQQANLARYLQGALTLLLAVMFGLIQWSNPMTLAAAYLLPTLPMLGLMGIYLQQQFRSWQLPRFDIYHRLVDYGIRAYGIELLGTLYLQIGAMLVVNVLTSSEFGWYAVALSLSRMLNLLQSSVVSVLLPKTAARPLPEVVQMTGQATRSSLLALLLPTLFVGGGAPWILSTLYGPDFTHAADTLRILLLESLTAGATYVLTRAFMALGRPGLVAILQIAGLAVAVPATVICVKYFGLLGASLALFGSSFFRLVITLICFPLLLKVPPPSLIPQRSDLLVFKHLILAKR